MTKTEDDIEREKEAVAKMIGAKGSMEKMLARHDRLVNALKHVSALAEDMGRRVGEDLYIKTYMHEGASGGESKLVSIRVQLARIDRITKEVI